MRRLLALFYRRRINQPSEDIRRWVDVVIRELEEVAQLAGFDEVEITFIKEI